MNNFLIENLQTTAPAFPILHPFLSKIHLFFYMQLGSNLALKFAYIFKIFGAQSSLMVA